MLRLILITLALAAGSGCATEGPLRPFATDGCSDFPEGTPSHKTLWQQCCIAHDKAYWAGGTCVERKAADRELRRCVAAVGEPGIAVLMLAGVRVGGSPYWPTRFRWGFGWPWPRGYRALTDAEREQVQHELESFEHQQDH